MCMFVFGIGMERCGTHSLARILQEACVQDSHIVHESHPLLCQEASLFINKGNWQTPALLDKINNYKCLAKDHDLVCEVNHRLVFFTEYLYQQFPNSKFIWLLREPKETIISRICTLAHWPHLLDKYPDFFQDAVKYQIPPTKREFNLFRPVPPAGLSLADCYIWEWQETYRENKRQFENIPSELRLLVRTEELTNKFEEIFSFIGRKYFVYNNRIKKMTTEKADARKADARLEAWAEELLLDKRIDL